FLISFSFHTPNAKEDDSKVQAFLVEMESGLEKYVMTKLFDRTFGTSTEDVVSDMDISEKIGLLQQFVKPRHLDIPKVQHNEALWLLAVKELQKINSFKAPREKLLCIMSCCQVINNLLLNISMSNDRTLSGADEFLPILIYVTIKANPPQLHSNLKFVQLFRRETKLILEVEYYLTNLISAKMFIIDVSAHSLSMEESEFQKHMESVRLATQVSVASPSSSQGLPTSTRANQEETHMAGSNRMLQRKLLDLIWQ
ncbi:hypothetical protein ACJX0J_038391, partial [Zea mays]